MAIRRSWAVLAPVVALVVAACTSAATPAPTAAPTAAGPTATPGPTKTTDGTLPKPELTTIRIGGSIQEPPQFAPKLAEMLGLFEKYGLKATVTAFNADGDASQAMLSGQIDMGAIGAAATINSQTTDSPARNIGMQDVKVTDGLFCGKDIKNATDLKGKSVAVSSLGATAHASVLLALEALKVPSSDIIVQAVGGQSARLAALKAGSVGCAPVDMNLKADMDALGLNLLVDLSKSELQYPSPGLAATVSFLQKNPNTALVALAAVLEAQNTFFTNPDLAATKWAEFAQIDKAKALELINRAPIEINRTLRWTDDGYKFVQKVMAIVSPQISSVDVTKAFDRSFLQTLEDIGFYKKIGLPLN